MSKFMSSKYGNLVPYTPGEQPKNMQYIKLNTNESPFGPSFKAIEAAYEEAKKAAALFGPRLHRTGKSILRCVRCRQRRGYVHEWIG